MHESGREENASYSPSLRFELLGEHVSTERDAALESHRREIGTLPSLVFRPCKAGGTEPRYAGAHKTQESEIGPDGLDSTAVVRPVWAETKELNNAGKIVDRRGVLNSRDILHLSRKRMLDGSRDQGSAIGHEELQQENHRADENDCGHHRGITASLEGTSLASSGKRQKA